MALHSKFYSGIVGELLELPALAPSALAVGRPFNDDDDFPTHKVIIWRGGEQICGC